jgi:hypothetical protein
MAITVPRRIVETIPQILPAVIKPRFVHVMLGREFMSFIAALPFDQAKMPRMPQRRSPKMPSTRTVVPSGCSLVSCRLYPEGYLWALEGGVQETARKKAATVQKDFQRLAVGRMDLAESLGTTCRNSRPGYVDI